MASRPWTGAASPGSTVGGAVVGDWLALEIGLGTIA
jgi:hypothetical protein